MSRALATLLRLRRLEVEAARRTLAEALRTEAAADQQLAAAAGALQSEAHTLPTGTVPALRQFTDWLPRGTAAKHAAAAAVRAAAGISAAARLNLAEQRAAESAVEKLIEAATDRAKLTAERRAAHALDDIVRSRRG